MVGFPVKPKWAKEPEIQNPANKAMMSYVLWLSASWTNGLGEL